MLVFSTWILGFAAEQSESETTLNVLVPVDRWTNTGKNLQQTRKTVNWRF